MGEVVVVPRTLTAIIREILHLCWLEEGAAKTRIVYQVNLNFKSINPYLETLLALGAIKKSDSKYKITPAGITLCRQIRALPACLGGLALAEEA
jgi:predicted transcriptional regulator